MNKFDIYYKKCLAFMPYPPKMKEAILKEINDYVKNHDDLFERDFPTMHDTVVQVNLDGLPKNYPRNYPYKYLNVVIKFMPIEKRDKNDTDGDFNHYENELTINVYYEDDHLINKDNISFTDTIEHELTHFSSFLLKDVIKKDYKNVYHTDYKGFPKEFEDKVYNIDPYDGEKIIKDKSNKEIKINTKDPYYLDPSEFWTQIRDIANLYKGMQISLDKFKEIVGMKETDATEIMFMKYKYNSKKMWIRAIKELYKLMNDYIK